jgi:hypothetical protein
LTLNYSLAGKQSIGTLELDGLQTFNLDIALYKRGQWLWSKLWFD